MTAGSGRLDLEMGTPPADVLDFRLPPSATPTASGAPDVAALVDRIAPCRLPDTVAGLPRANAAWVDGAGGVGTHGRGFATVAVLPLPRGIARETFRSRDGSSLVREVDVPGQQALALDTPLVSALVVRGEARAYLLAGTVVPGVVRQAVLDLVLDPPPLRPERAQ